MTSRRSSKRAGAGKREAKEHDYPEGDAGLAIDLIRGPVSNLDIESDHDGKVAVAKESKKIKKKAKKSIVQKEKKKRIVIEPSEEEEEEEVVVIPEAAEEEEEEEEEKVAATAALVRKPVKVSNEGRAQGSRFDKVGTYRTMLKKNRDRAFELKKKKDPAAVRPSSRHVAEREVKYLSRANGLYLTSAHSRRVALDAISKALGWIKIENARQIERLERRGKTVPRNLVVPEKILNISPDAVQLLRGAAQVRLDQVSELSTVLCEYSKRETVSKNDIVTAKQILSRFA